MFINLKLREGTATPITINADDISYFGVPEDETRGSNITTRVSREEILVEESPKEIQKLLWHGNLMCQLSEE